ncbi:MULTISPECIES: LysR family transcriptional regulator [unclassified Pseudarthrobacter]|uniref:LysR family transcriptional regulator n=1 Tax=unclassified Pseudarthrobacter TaxID=2647000 RepID=UPI001627D211|nr:MULTISPECIES: LysR family transcriptional regulator [unclassified Pseudarthrobacter]MBE4720436.1 LysR family transcriptional regulator [Pseudarthrobacter sp. AB1]QNE14472.1 LysR family transcriptional regulator [Pseudarthrobacter sp. NBSH8]
MELRQLRYFIAVAEEMHFNRAAARLHIAQPALSQQIQRLERNLKTQLFVRTTRSVEITDTGRVLLEAARRVISEAERAESQVELATRGSTGLLRVGFVSSAALFLLPGMVNSMHEQWPQVQFQLQENTTERQIQGVLEGQLDVGIVREIEPIEGIHVTALRREPLIVAVPHSHPLAQRASVPLKELAGQDFVVFPRHQVSRLYDLISALCIQAGFHIRVAQEAIQFPTILGLVAARTGIAIVPESLRALQIPGVAYLDLTDAAAYSRVSLICAEGRQDSALVERFMEAGGV